MAADFRAHFSRALRAAPKRLHFAAHSHHLWPDAAVSGHMAALEDGFLMADQKWERVFSELIPACQNHISRLLNLPEPDSCVFAPNTHELVMRLFSCLPERAKILTTDSEFHSFRRQLDRLEESGDVSATRLAIDSIHSLVERLLESLRSQPFDMVFLSQVFFTSGEAVTSLPLLLDALPEDCLLVVDGYHGFMALPTDFHPMAHRAFYLAGGYKYAMAGEGCCFLHVPASHRHLRPRYTGWFAAFDHLESTDLGVTPYSQGAQRFAGATFDPSGLYRFRAVQNWLFQAGLSAERVHGHVRDLQRLFLEQAPALALAGGADLAGRGHFLSFRIPDAAGLQARLLAQDMVTDRRGDFWRVGFGLYHTEEDVNRLCLTLKKLYS